MCAKELIFYIPQEASRCSAPYRHRKMTYIVRKRIFARCGRAARAKRDFFSWIDFFCQDGSNEVSHVHGKGREVCFHPDGRTDGPRDPDREKRHYQNIYIDKQNQTCLALCPTLSTKALNLVNNLSPLVCQALSFITTNIAAILPYSIFIKIVPIARFQNSQIV